MRPVLGELPHRPRPAWRRTWAMVPIALFLVALFLYPVAQLLWLSIFDKSGGLTGDHYQRLFLSPVYLQVLRITLEVAGWTTALCILGGYPIAYLLATASRRTRDSLILWVLLPFWTSFLVRTFAWIVLLGRNGALNSALQTIGLTEEPTAFLYNMTGVMVGMVHALMPIAVLTMLSVMENIDRNLVPAAATMGARGGEAFWRIYFPLSLPGVAAAGLLVFITAIGFFITPALLGAPQQTMIAQIIIQQVMEMLNYPFAGAIAMLLLVTAIAVFYLYDRALGMSTLAGEATTGQLGGGTRGLVGRVFAGIGTLLTAALGRVTDGIAILWEALAGGRVDRPPRASGRVPLRVAVVLLLIFLAGPSFIIVPVSFTTEGFIEWPPKGISLKWYWAMINDQQWTKAIFRSLIVGFFTACLAMALGGPAAFFLARRRFAGKTAALAFILSPLILPRIVIAVALFYFYARLGLVDTELGLVLGHTVLALPYVVITVMAVLKNYDQRLDQAAASLGASPPRVLWYITVPVIKSGLIAAFLFAFVTSFDELTIALFMSSGISTTLPKQMWDDAIMKVSPLLAAVSTVLLFFVTLVILTAEYFQRRAGAKR
ncbi:MAG: ABC transporter permease subunit [Rhodospirillales bacterium]|nr:ABC transporter permease subunit [Rhodospirillales bacterium]